MTNSQQLLATFFTYHLHMGVRWHQSTTHTQGCLRHTGRMPLLIWWNSTSCRRSMKSVRPSSMVKYFLPPSSHCREERRDGSESGGKASGRQTGTHRDHQVVFDLELMTQRQDEALTVLLALTDQEHAATQTRVIAMETDGQFTTRTTPATPELCD